MSVIPSSTSQIDSLLQLPTDSMIVWVKEECQTTNERFPMIAHHLLKRNLEKNDLETVALIHGYISFWNYINYEVNGIDSTIYHRKKQIAYHQKVGNLPSVAKGYIDLAIDYLNDNQLNNGQDTLFKAIEIYESIDDQSGIAEAHAILAYLYVVMEKPEEALKFLKLSFSFFEKEKEYFMMVDLLIDGFYSAYMLLEDYPKALECTDQAIELCSRPDDFQQKQDMLIVANNNKGSIYLAQKEFVLAEAFFNKAWQLDRAHSGTEKANRYRYEIGDSYFQQGKYKEALPHLVAGMQALEINNDHSSNKKIRVSECYEKLGQYKEALAYRSKAFEAEEKFLKDNIANLESEIMVKYETGKKEQQLLEQAQVIQQKNWIQWLVIMIASLLGIFLITLLYFFRKNQKNNLLLLEKNSQIAERNAQNEVLLKEIHHRVKNNLQIISSLLNLQHDSIKDDLVKAAILDSQSRVHSMSLIHQKLCREENLGEIEMRSYLGSLAESLVSTYAGEEIEIDLDMNDLDLEVDYAIPIGLIANELVTNALKYAFPNGQKGSIKIQLIKQDEDFLLLIADDGVGKSKEKITEAEGGFGSDLIQMLCDQLKGELVESNVNGFETQLRFPNPKVA